jgi:hypothetical protein
MSLIWKAHDRVRQALGVVLAGDGFLDRVKVFFSGPDEKGIREQVRSFLQGNAVSLGTAWASRSTTPTTTAGVTRCGPTTARARTARSSWSATCWSDGR